MGSAEPQTPTPQPLLEVLTQERLLDLSRAFGIGLRDGRETKARMASGLGDKLALKDPTNDDPRIVELRRLHEEMDRAATSGRHRNPALLPRTDADGAALQACPYEVIDRVCVLNATRAREETRRDPAKRGTQGEGHRRGEEPRPAEE